MPLKRKGSKKTVHPTPLTLSPIAVNEMPFEVVSHSDGPPLGSPSPFESPGEVDWRTASNPPTPRVQPPRCPSTSPWRPVNVFPPPDYPGSRCLSPTGSTAPSIDYEEASRGRSISPLRSCAQSSRSVPRSRPHSPCYDRPKSVARSPVFQRSGSPPGRLSISLPSPSPSPCLNPLPEPAFVYRDIEKPRHEAMRLVHEFSTALSQDLHGFPSPSPAKGLMPSIHAGYQRFTQELYGTAPQFRPWKSTDRVDKAALMKSLKVEDDAVSLGSVNKLYLNEVAELAQRQAYPFTLVSRWPLTNLRFRYRMGELENEYPKAVQTHLLRASTERWKGIAEKCFTIVERTILERVEMLAAEHFGAYHSLKAEVLQSVRSIISEVAEATRSLIDHSSRCESSIYTLNEKDLKDYRDHFLGLYQDVHRQSLGQGSLISALNNHTPSIRPSNSSDAQKWQHINNAIASLSALGISGVTAEALTRVIPPSESNAELEIMAEVRAYFEIAYKRFGDNVPNQINTSFIGGIKNGIDGALTSMVLDVTEEDCRKWFECP